MSPTDEEIDAMAVAISRVSGHQESWREWRYEARAAWLVASTKAESDLSSAREEMARIGRLLVEAAIPLEAVNMAGGFNGYSPEVNRAMCDSMMSIRLYMSDRESLRSSRTKGETL